MHLTLRDLGFPFYTNDIGLSASWAGVGLSFIFGQNMLTQDLLSFSLISSSDGIVMPKMKYLFTYSLVDRNDMSVICYPDLLIYSDR